MTATVRTTPNPSAQVGWPRRTLSVLCLGLPALAVLAFGGQLLILGWLDSRPDGTFHVHDLAWGSAEGILLFVALVAASWNPRRLPAALQQALVVVGAAPGHGADHGSGPDHRRPRSARRHRSAAVAGGPCSCLVPTP